MKSMKTQVIEWAKEANMGFDTRLPCVVSELERFAELVAAAEREACAKLCEQADDDEFYFGRNYAKAIRAKGQND